MEFNQRPLKIPLTMHQQKDHCREFISILLLDESQHALNYKMIYMQIGKQIVKFQWKVIVYWPFMTYSKVLEGNLVIYLSSEPLSKWITIVRFALFQKVDVFKLWLSIRIKNFYIELVTHLTSSGGNLSSPVDFFTSIFFWNFKISASSTFLKQKVVSLFASFLFL